MNKFFHILITTSVFAATMIFAGCTGTWESGKTLSERISDTSWTPVFLDGRDGAKMPDKKIDGCIVYLQISKDSKRMNGMSGDNLFGGEIQISDDGKFKTDKVYSTRRMGPFSQYEFKFLSAINNADGISLENDKLVLSKDGKPLVEFEKTSDAPKE